METNAQQHLQSLVRDKSWTVRFEFQSCVSSLKKNCTKKNTVYQDDNPSPSLVAPIIPRASSNRKIQQEIDEGKGGLWFSSKDKIEEGVVCPLAGKIWFYLLYHDYIVYKLEGGSYDIPKKSRVRNGKINFHIEKNVNNTRYQNDNLLIRLEQCHLVYYRLFVPLPQLRQAMRSISDQEKQVQSESDDSSFDIEIEIERVSSDDESQEIQDVNHGEERADNTNGDENDEQRGYESQEIQDKKNTYESDKNDDQRSSDESVGVEAQEQQPPIPQCRVRVTQATRKSITPKKGNQDVIVVLLRPPVSMEDPRNDPFWEFGSFGLIESHRYILNENYMDILSGARLAFVQCGDLKEKDGSIKPCMKLVYLTDPIGIVKHKTILEATWKPQMPFKFITAPLFCDKHANSDFPSILEPEVSPRKKWNHLMKYLSSASFKNKVLKPKIAQEIIEIYNRKWEEGIHKTRQGYKIFAEHYMDALAEPTHCVTENRADCYYDLLVDQVQSE